MQSPDWLDEILLIPLPTRCVVFTHDSKYYITASPAVTPRDDSELTGQGGAEPVQPAGAHD